MIPLSRHDAQLWDRPSDPLFVMNETIATAPTGRNRLERPVIFVTGGPRSGTTVMAQTLCHALDVAYVDGAAARFWRAPLLGAEYSRQLFGGFPRTASFRSDYGRAAPQDIHSFHLFWLHNLRLRHARDLFAEDAADSDGWDRVAGYLGDIQSFWERPLVMKGYYPSYFMPQVCALSEQVVFVVITRDAAEQARSIYQARLDENDSLDQWWSMFPPGYSDLMQREWPEQIAGQCAGLRRMFEEQAVCADTRAIMVDYASLCDDPGRTVADIAGEIVRHTGATLMRTGEPVAVQRRDPAPVPGDDLDRLMDALENIETQPARSAT